MSKSLNERAPTLGPRLTPIALAALLVTGLALFSTPEVAVAQMAKVDICHQNADGRYVKISVAEAAYESHVNHGDRSVGDPVPGLTGYEFDEDCLIQAIQAIDCPCFSATGVAEEIAVCESAGGVEVMLSDQDYEGGFYETTLSIWNPILCVSTFEATHLDDMSPNCAAWWYGWTITSAEAATCRAILLEFAP